MQNYLFLKISMVCLFLLTGISAYADKMYEERIERDFTHEAPLKPFNEKDLEGATICKGVPDDMSFTGDPSSLFSNAKKIYLWSSRSNIPDIEGSLLSQENMSNIAGCALGRVLGSYKNASYPPSRIPIYMPKRNDINIKFWPEADIDGNLLIWIDLSFYHKQRYDGFETNGINNLTVRFYRKDSHSIADLRNLCSYPFPHTKDQAQYQRFLTNAISSCISSPFAFR